jgi:hypothetical protein
MCMLVADLRRGVHCDSLGCLCLLEQLVSGERTRKEEESRYSGSSMRRMRGGRVKV